MWYLKVTLYDIFLIDLQRTNETIAIRVQRDFWSSERQLFDWREPIHSWCYSRYSISYSIACRFFQLGMFLEFALCYCCPPPPPLKLKRSHTDSLLLRKTQLITFPPSSLPLSLSLSLSISLTHTHTHKHKHVQAHTHTLSLPSHLQHTHTHMHTKQKHTYTLPLSQHTHINTHT